MIMNRIVNAIANATIPVSFEIWVIRNLIITACAVLCICLNADRSIFVAMGVLAIIIAWKA